MLSTTLFILALQAARPSDAGPVPEEALVLGFRTDAETPLKTLLVTASDATVLGDGLALPTAQGWRRLSEEAPDRRAPDWKSVASQAPRSKGLPMSWLPFSRSWPPIPEAEFAEDCGESTGEERYREAFDDLEIVFAAPSLITVRDFGGDDSCGNHPHSSEDFESHEMCEGAFSPPVHLDQLDRVLGVGALDALNAAEKAPDAHQGIPEPEAGGGVWSAYQWRIGHEKGTWSLVGAIPGSGVGGALTSFEFPVPFAVPPSLIGGSTAVSPAQLAEAGAYDGIGAPSGKWWVGFQPGGVVLVSPTHVVQVGIPEFNGPYAGSNGRVTVVMTQWAVGARNVARWQHELAFMTEPLRGR